MSSINIAGDTSGSISLTVPSVAGTNNVTIPASSGVVMVSGNMPAFSAYLSASQNITVSTWTKIAYNTKVFDTASVYDNATNYRITPLIAGYYQINATFAANSTATNPTNSGIAIYKNGSIYNQCNSAGSTVTSVNPAISAVVYLNGSTDYIEIYAYMNGGTGTLQAFGGSTYTYFSGSLVRGA